MNNGHYIQKALELFKQDPHVQAALNSRVSPEIAKALGESIEELEYRTLFELFTQRADLDNTDTLRLALDMVATPHQKKQALAQYHEDTANALGISLDEYLKINPQLKAELE
ncbi:DUF6388 family protein [Acinetobacter oleivorans]|uniref:DUF6388 family protein n=1 Tax=Acinetobacter oleivorans TaxID=1148157 RepID=UPI002B25FE34|nr:DUF6388 family protein [Acinetobacter oleivorans]WQF74984.1 DUF6388 family protein [Acinetobacter oleivorans]